MLLNYFNSGNNDFYDGLGEVRGPRLEPNATTVLPWPRTEGDGAHGQS